MLGFLNKTFVEPFYMQYQKDQKELKIWVQNLENEIKDLKEKDNTKIDFTKDFEISYKND